MHSMSVTESPTEGDRAHSAEETVMSKRNPAKKTLIGEVEFLGKALAVTEHLSVNEKGAEARSGSLRSKTTAKAVAPIDTKTALLLVSKKVTLKGATEAVFESSGRTERPKVKGEKMVPLMATEVVGGKTVRRQARRIEALVEVKHGEASYTVGLKFEEEVGKDGKLTGRWMPKCYLNLQSDGSGGGRAATKPVSGLDALAAIL
jgi:hypothetical protein